MQVGAPGGVRGSNRHQGILGEDPEERLQKAGHHHLAKAGPPAHWQGECAPALGDVASGG
jgi:hypothetical protein